MSSGTVRFEDSAVAAMFILVASLNIARSLPSQFVTDYQDLINIPMEEQGTFDFLLGKSIPTEREQNARLSQEHEQCLGFVW